MNLVGREWSDDFVCKATKGSPLYRFHIFFKILGRDIERYRKLGPLLQSLDEP